MHNRVECDVCEGTGRETITGETTMVCHNGCDDGYFDAEPRDLAGRRAQHGHVIGTLETWKGVLCLYDDEADAWVVNLDPLTVELLP